MLKKITLSAMIAMLSLLVNAQTKVFKQISEDIKVRTKPIVQNGNVIGYFVFSQLEKTSKDSFSYQITLMDENLNEIGKKDFKHKKLYLYDIAFENDIFCIGYLKRDEKGMNDEDKKAAKKNQKNIDHEVILQFMDLQGNFVKTIVQKVEVDGQNEISGYFGRKVYQDKESYLKETLQINELEGKGFVVFYGDNNSNKMFLFTSKGDTVWSHKVKGEAKQYYLSNTSKEIFLLASIKVDFEKPFGRVFQHDKENGKELYNYDLVDDKKRPVTILSISENPVTKGLSILGKYEVLNGWAGTGRVYTDGYIESLVSFNFNGNTKKEVIKNITFWEDGSKKPEISRSAKFQSIDAHNTFEIAYTDFDGNPVFGGSGIKSSPRWGAIATTVGLSWTIIVPIVNMVAGFTKMKNVDGYLIKQNAKGNLSVVNTIPLEHQNAIPRNKIYYGYYSFRDFGVIKDKSKKTVYVQVNNPKQSIIFNTTTNKIVKTIPVKVGRKTTLSVFPAKEGHIMIVENNEKEKTTTLSIESLN